MSDKPRHWCFTVFDMDWDISGIDLENDVRYMIVGAEETSMEVKRPHFQCYAEFHKPVRIAGAKKAIKCSTAHFEPRGGTREQARDYCKKGQQSHEEWKELGTKGPNYGLNASFAEYGEWEKGSQGKRNDIAKLREDIRANEKTELELFENHDVMFRVYNSASKYRLLVKAKQAKEAGYRKREVIIHWGPTGTGKTYSAIAGSEKDYYIVNRSNTSSGSWWDSYDGEKNVIFDEFYGSWMKLAELLRICDGYHMEVPTKGGHKTLEATRIYLVSNHHPDEWYPNMHDDEKWKAFKRRVTRVLEFIDGDREFFAAIDEKGEVELFERPEGAPKPEPAPILTPKHQGAVQLPLPTELPVLPVWRG